MDDHNRKANNRITIVSILVALSVALIAILHSDNKILGLEIIQGSFTGTITNFARLALAFATFSGAVFIITTGYFNGFHYDENYRSDIKLIQTSVLKWHQFIAWLHRQSYNCTIGAFIFSTMSIILNIITKILGFDSIVNIIMAITIVAAAMLIIVAPILADKFKKRDKKS